MNLRILVVDDEPNIRTMLRFCLGDANDVVEAGSVAEAEAKLKERDFDLAFVDLRLGDGDGLSLLPRCVPTTPVVVMTAFGTIETAVKAMQRGASEYLQKPFTAPQVQLLVEKLVHERTMKGELQTLRAEGRAPALDATAQSPAMRQVVALARRVAGTDATVLLRGETGCGKGVMARAIHDASPRAGGPFIVVDLTSIASSLLESELFGHARGAFTGATSAALGRVEMARGGTLFLDEVGELPLALQPKLLRLVQDQRFERVGESTTRQGDVRLVAATHRDLKKMVADGQFREDLYFRLKVVELIVPPLRDRRDDILPLANDFLARSARKARSPARAFTDAAQAVLRSYDWPGNVRELQNAVERAVILCEGPLVDADLFAGEAASVSRDDAAADPDGETLAAAERRHIASVLAKHATMEEAARALGIDVVTLWRRRKKYRLD